MENIEEKFAKILQLYEKCQLSQALCKIYEKIPAYRSSSTK